MKPTLVILAAGMGSRYGSLKQVDGLGPNDETIIDYSVFDAMRAGFKKVVFVIRKHIEKEFREVFSGRFRGKVDFELVFQELDMLPEGFTCPPEREKPWGTAHAVWVARNKVKEPFAVINADDFYGQEAFESMAKALSDPPPRESNYFLAGYRLGNTLSDQGHVSRAICTTDEKGYLESIVERTKIGRENKSVFYINESGEKVPADEDSLVSMNFWGFTPDFFNRSGEIFDAFLKGNINKAASEFFIPLVVDKLIKKREATCRVIPTQAGWFGVTYPGDKPVVKQKLLQLVKEGRYPSPLWQ